MTELKREEFQGTWFDVSEWTEKQKVKFQLKCFELGYRWLGHEERPQELDAARYFLIRNCVTYSHSQYESAEHNVEKFYEDMSPDHEAPKPIDVAEEIKQLFLAEMDKEYSEGDEDERGFEGLVYADPKDYTPNIAKRGLSDDQLNFIIGKFGGLAVMSKEDDTHIYIDDGVVKTTSYTLYTTKDKIVTFNDLFKYEDEL